MKLVQDSLILSSSLAVLAVSKVIGIADPGLVGTREKHPLTVLVEMTALNSQSPTIDTLKLAMYGVPYMLCLSHFMHALYGYVKALQFSEIG